MALAGLAGFLACAGSDAYPFVYALPTDASTGTGYVKA
jgi:hypothetical protein